MLQFHAAQAQLVRRTGIHTQRCKPHKHTEFGLGGGETPDYKTPARTAAAAAANPYWGVDGRYSPARDPWAAPELRGLLRRYYNASLAFAAAGGGPTYKVGFCVSRTSPRLCSLLPACLHPEVVFGLGIFPDSLHCIQRRIGSLHRKEMI